MNPLFTFFFSFSELLQTSLNIKLDNREVESIQLNTMLENIKHIRLSFLTNGFYAKFIHLLL